MRGSSKERLMRRVDQLERFGRGRGILFRVAWGVAGATILVAGIAMLVFPGPAVVVIPIGLAMLSLEFAWAKRLLEVTIERGDDAASVIARARPRAKLLGAVSVLCLAAAVVAFLVLR